MKALTYGELEQQVAQLQKSEEEHKNLIEELETIFNYCLDMIGSGNLAGYFTKVNSSFARILGYSDAEMTASPFLSFVHQDDLAKTKAALDAAANGVAKEIYIENRYICKDGSIKWIDWKVLVNSKEKRFIAVGRDITSRKQADEQLRLQSQIIDNMAEGVCLIRFDDLTIIYANPKFEQMFGYNPGEIIDRPVTILNAPSRKTPEQTAKDIMQILQEKGEWHGEVYNIRKDGSTFWCATKVSTFNHLTYGKVIVSVRTDITERIAAQEALARSEDLFRDFVEGTDNLIAQVDTDGRLTYVNNTARIIFGLEKEECIGLSAFDFIHPDDLDDTKQAFAAWLRDRTPNITFENRQMSRSGAVHHMLWTINLHFDDTGDVTRINSIARDITELKKAEDELLKSREELQRRIEERSLELQQTHDRLLHAEKLAAVGKLSASIAHEINNPLYGIQNVMQGIKRNVELDAEYGRLVDLALSECRRVKNLIRNLQDFNRPSSGCKELVDVHRLLDDMVTLIKKQYKKAHIAVQKHYDVNLPRTLLVQDQMKQVFLNLLANAGDAITSPTGVIGITSEKIDNGIKISISDNGCGIEPDILPHIFEPFFTTKRAVKGTGLGLSVSYGIVKAHGGDILIESKPGEGTVVSVLLPVEE